jgi:hypothetical protein
MALLPLFKWLVDAKIIDYLEPITMRFINKKKNAKIPNSPNKI